MRFAERVLKMKKLSELIPEGIRSCAIAGHLNPDGDCVGSVTAVWQYIRKYRPEIEVALFLERPADELMFLPGMEEILSETPETERKDLFISCDASSVDRIGVAENLFHAAALRVCIDHHIRNPGFADVNVIDAEASSCAEVLCGLIDDQELTKEIADSLFTGIIHDSGVFQYSNTRPETLRAAARLMEKEAACSKIIDESFNMRSFRKQRMLGKALGESRLCLDGQVIMTCVTEEDMKAEGADKRDLDGIVAEMRYTEGTQAAVFFYQTGPEEFKVSFRSSSDLDVSKIAAVFGGGGHVRAAGCTLAGPLSESIEKVMDALSGCLNK